MVTFGTGTGVAVVRAGGAHRGAGRMHPESGHLLVGPSGSRCFCGGHGCWEPLAAAPALERAARASMHPEVALADACRVGRLDRARHAEARLVVTTAARHAAAGLVNVIAAYAPDVLVLGRRVIGACEGHLEEVRALGGCSNPYLPPGDTAARSGRGRWPLANTPEQSAEARRAPACGSRPGFVGLWTLARWGAAVALPSGQGTLCGRAIDPWGSETRIRSCGEPVVLMDEAAEQVPSSDVSRAHRDGVPSFG
jgi:predicted NBD/HSP70 family sugar kinase